MDEEWRKRLVEQIEVGFADTPYPKRQGFQTEYEFVTEGIAGKHWSEIELSILILSADRRDFYEFNYAQLRFYLPAFLKAAVLHPYELGMLSDTLMSDFVPPYQGDYKREMAEREEWVNEIRPGLSDRMTEVLNQLEDLREEHNQFFRPDEVRKIQSFVRRAYEFSAEEKATIASFFESYLKVWPENYVYSNIEKEKIVRAAIYWKDASLSEGFSASLEKSRNTILQKIESVFKRTPYPGDDNIGTPSPFGGSVLGTYHLFKGDWRKVPLDIVKTTSMTDFSPEGFRYYLPAFLRASVLAFDVVYHVFLFLIPYVLDEYNAYDDPEWKERYWNDFLKQASLFSSKEKKVIQNYLEYYAQFFLEFYSNYEEVYIGSKEKKQIERGIRFWSGAEE